jgi:hypothetical protein
VKDPIFARAEFLASNMKRQNVQSVILLILYDLRIPVNCDGFGYLKHAILIASRTTTQIMETEIFEAVGNLYTPKVSFRNMDTAVHAAIQKAWKTRVDDRWERYLPEYLIERRKPPSNLEFICAIVYFLEFWQDCYEKEANYETA